MTVGETRILHSLREVAEGARRRIISSVTSPFGHAPYPLTRTLDHRGDPGLLGPGSVSWHVLADVATFVGGIRGLLVQALHPEVVAGVADHSRYRDDPLGRLSRTSAYVTATTYGAIPEVEQAVAQVRRAHRIVRGTSSRGRPYDAGDPGLSAWVHNVLTESFVVAHQTYGGIRLSPEQESVFVAEQTRIGALLDSHPMPSSAPALARWIEYHPDLEPSIEMHDAVEFLSHPPLDPGLMIGYAVLFEAAIATIPNRLRNMLGLTRTPLAITAGRATVAGLRWALGYSPSWHLALIRCSASVPDGWFRQPTPIPIVQG